MLTTTWIFARSAAGRAATIFAVLAIVIVVFTFSETNTSVAQSTGVLPVCGTNISVATWFAGNPYSEISNDQNYVDQYFVAPGLKFDCACQNKGISTVVCTNTINGTSCVPTTTSFARLTDASAQPDTISASSGDGQEVVLSTPGLVQTGWTGCFPGSNVVPGLCPASIFTGDAYTGGTLLYRFRGADGTFSGLWTVSTGQNSPGFWLQQTGTQCAISATTCSFKVMFARDSQGYPVVHQDAQVLIQLVAEDATWSDYIVIPMLIEQTGPPSPAPTVKPASHCVVPTTIGLTLSSAEKAVKATACKVGNVSKAKSKKVAKGRIISSNPKAKTSHKVGTKVALVVSSGK